METPTSSSFVDLCTLHQHAMRYYRLWIYICNCVIATATILFIVFAISVWIDPRVGLLSDLHWTQPSFLYGFLAIFLQCGVVQAIGCIGAIRLNPKLLNFYWTLLFLLLIGDFIIGIVWAFRLTDLRQNFEHNLKNKFKKLYRVEDEFTGIWDWVQLNDACCGVDGVGDYNGSALLPSSCCSPNESQVSLRPLRRKIKAQAQSQQQQPIQVLLHCELPSDWASSKTNSSSTIPIDGLNFNSSSSLANSSNSWPGLAMVNSTHWLSNPHMTPCSAPLLSWLDHVTDILFILGFCICVFVKICFLAILRYEIREMIQKIQLIQSAEGEGGGLTSFNEMIGLSSSSSYSNGGGGGGNNNVVK